MEIINEENPQIFKHRLDKKIYKCEKTNDSEQLNLITRSFIHMQNGKVIKHIDKLDYNNPILISSCMESQILKKNRFAELKCEIDVINDTHFFSSSIIIENNDLEFVYNVQTEYGNKPYICSICKKWFGRLSTFLSHMKVHNTSRKSINRCSLCGCLTFFSSKELTKKNNKAIISNKTPFKCRICQIIF